MRREAKMDMVFIDLVLDNGDLICIECPSKYEDELYEDIKNSMKRGDYWAPSSFDGCSASYLGHSLDWVMMCRVVGLM